MSFNLFDWLRVGVRNSVIMGVHDAIGCLDETDNSETIRNHLVSFVEDANKETAKTTKTKSSRRNSTKKLGRTLKDIQTQQGTT